MTTGTGEKSSLGLDANLVAALSYVFGLLSGVIVFLLEKQSRLVRFHALQSILLSAALFVAFIVVGVIPVIGAPLRVLLWFGSLVVWVLLMVKAFQGEMFKLPGLGDLAEKNTTKAG